MHELTSKCTKQSLLLTSLAMEIKLTWNLGMHKTLFNVKEGDKATLPDIDAVIWVPSGKLTWTRIIVL